MLLPRLTVHGYSDGVGPVSPHVYYWRDGHISQVTAIEDAVLKVTPTPELVEILNGGQ